MTSFVGYSSKNKLKGPFTLRDMDLSIADFVNHLETRKGSRVMLPEFGSILPELVMDYQVWIVEQQNLQLKLV